MGICCSSTRSPLYQTLPDLPIPMNMEERRRFLELDLSANPRAEFNHQMIITPDSEDAVFGSSLTSSFISADHAHDYAQLMHNFNHHIFPRPGELLPSACTVSQWSAMVNADKVKFSSAAHGVTFRISNSLESNQQQIEHHMTSSMSEKRLMQNDIMVPTPEEIPTPMRMRKLGRSLSSSSAMSVKRHSNSCSPIQCGINW